MPSRAALVLFFIVSCGQSDVDKARDEGIATLDRYMREIDELDAYTKSLAGHAVAPSDLDNVVVTLRAARAQATEARSELTEIARSERADDVVQAIGRIERGLLRALDKARSGIHAFELMK